MGKRLARYVEVGGVTYGPDDDVPDNIAEQITNPKAWATDASVAGGDGGRPQQREPGTSGPHLARYVEVAGVRYGPDDEVPDHVAAQITNPAAWVDRELPPAAAQTVERRAAQPAARPGGGPVSQFEFGGAVPTLDEVRAAVDQQSPASGADSDGDGGDPDPDVPPADTAPPAEETAPPRKAAGRKATGSGA